MLKPITLLVIVPLLYGCASTVKDYQKTTILETSADESMPEWAKKGELTPFRIVDGKVYSVGITTLRGSERPEAGARVAENNARANYSKTISNRMEFILQNAEEGFDMNSTQTRFIGSEASSLTSHSMTLEGVWWKRYAQSEDDGSHHIYYKIYSLVSMPEMELKKAIEAAINKSTNDHKLSQSFQAKVDAQWDHFVEDKAPERSLANQKPAQ